MNRKNPLRWFFDFSEEPKFFEKLIFIFLGFSLYFFWMVHMMLFLVLLGYPISQISGIVTASPTAYLSGVVLQDVLPWPALVFLACVLAPIWEEFAFRVFPLNLNKIGFLVAEPSKFLLYFSLLSSIIFGLAHGAAVNILFQGVFGLILCWVYLRCRRSYWPIVVFHALWNSFVIFVLGL